MTISELYEIKSQEVKDLRKAVDKLIGENIKLKDENEKFQKQLAKKDEMVDSFLRRYLMINVDIKK